MSIFQEWREFLSKFNNLSEEQIIKDFWNNPLTLDYIVFLNTEEQLRKGLRADGNLMDDYFSVQYLNAKRALGLRKIPGEELDLFLTGTFYDTFIAKAVPEGAEITANTNIYGRDFEAIYGPIVGLSPESIVKLREFAKELVKDIIKERLKIR